MIWIISVQRGSGILFPVMLIRNESICLLCIFHCPSLSERRFYKTDISIQGKSESSTEGQYHQLIQVPSHADLIKWKHFPRYWPFVWGPWRGALMFSLICVWINDWVDNREAGDLRRYHAYYDVIVMLWCMASTEKALRFIFEYKISIYDWYWIFLNNMYSMKI